MCSSGQESGARCNSVSSQRTYDLQGATFFADPVDLVAGGVIARANEDRLPRSLEDGVTDRLACIRLPPL